MNREEITNNVGYAQEQANSEYIKYRQEHKQYVEQHPKPWYLK